ncbi:MAG: fluoride efflux transporter CrcB [Halobacteriaceae archaeon]
MAGLTPAAALLVGLGGSLGASLRYLVGEAVAIEGYPLPTLTVNVLGSFALAVLTFAGADSTVVLFVGTGACGAFTTFSSFAVETVELWDSGEPGRAITYAFGTTAAAGAAVALGWAVTTVP